MRILQAAVIIMGVLIFVGLGVLVWGLFNLNSNGEDVPVMRTGPSTSAPLPTFDRVSLGLPDGCDIVGASAGSGRLVVRTSCGEIWLLDVASGRPLGVIER